MKSFAAAFDDKPFMCLSLSGKDEEKEKNIYIINLNKANCFW
jgi:hypothetical protein